MSRNMQKKKMPLKKCLKAPWRRRRQRRGGGGQKKEAGKKNNK